MPIVKVKGKSKHLSYTPSGEKAAAEMASKLGGKVSVDPRKIGRRKTGTASTKSSRYGIRNLKKG